MPNYIFTQCLSTGREIPLELLGNFCRKALKPLPKIIEKQGCAVDQLTGLALLRRDP